MEQNPQLNLEDNDLQGTLAKAKAWWDQHGTKVLLVVLLIALTLTGRRFYQRHLEQQRDESWGGLATATSPDVSRMLAESYTKPGFQAAAYLRAGDLLLYRAFRDSTTHPPTTTPDATASAPPDRQRDLTEARSYFQKVVDLPGASELFKLNAKLGLAAIAEELNETAQAKALYLEIEAQAGAKYPAIVAQARNRAARVERISRPVQFAKDMPRPILPIPDTTHGTPGLGSPQPDLLPQDIFTPAPAPTTP